MSLDKHQELGHICIYIYSLRTSSKILFYFIHSMIWNKYTYIYFKQWNTTFTTACPIMFVLIIYENIWFKNFLNLILHDHIWDRWICIFLTKDFGSGKIFSESYNSKGFLGWCDILGKHWINLRISRYFL